MGLDSSCGLQPLKKKERESKKRLHTPVIESKEYFTVFLSLTAAPRRDSSWLLEGSNVLKCHPRHNDPDMVFHYIDIAAPLFVPFGCLVYGFRLCVCVCSSPCVHSRLETRNYEETQVPIDVQYCPNDLKSSSGSQMYIVYITCHHVSDKLFGQQIKSSLKSTLRHLSSRNVFLVLWCPRPFPILN